jgi:enolase
MSTIIDIHAREILDSRGNPTVEVDVTLEDGTMGRAAVPSGASTGAMRRWKNATATRPLHGQGRAGGRGRRQRRTSEMPRRLRRDRAGGHRRRDVRDRRHARTRAGWAPTRSSACRSPWPRPPPITRRQPLYRYVGGTAAHVLPVPMMNIVNGGEHADNPIDIQEFMIMPVGAESLADAVRMGSEVFHTLKKELSAAGLSTPGSATRAASRPTSRRPAKRSISS